MEERQSLPLTAVEFQAMSGVSEGCLDALETYLRLLEKWQRRINLVASSSLGDPWRRHILDSAQVFPHLPPDQPVVLDVGSGAGFPGLVLAMMGASSVHLVESNQRKCAFLGEVISATGTAAEIHAARLEALAPFPVDVVTARAVSRLDAFLQTAQTYFEGGAMGLILKGRRVEEELTESEKNWMMRVTRIPSISDPSGMLLKLENVARRHG